jgi:hypothetical protein
MKQPARRLPHKKFAQFILARALTATERTIGSQAEPLPGYLPGLSTAWQATQPWRCHQGAAREHRLRGVWPASSAKTPHCLNQKNASHQNKAHMDVDPESTPAHSPVEDSS